MQVQCEIHIGKRLGKPLYHGRSAIHHPAMRIRYVVEHVHLPVSYANSAHSLVRGQDSGSPQPKIIGIEGREGCQVFFDVVVVVDYDGVSADGEVVPLVKIWRRIAMVALSIVHDGLSERSTPVGL
jgi:hypothetical protein